MTSSASEFDVAIVGAACRLPGAITLEGYWQNLVGGVNCITQFSTDELLQAGVPLELIESEKYVKAAPVIASPGRFDARFFGYTPKDAQLMDPQHRHILELSWQAFEDASIVPGDKQERTGVYAGSAFNSYVLATGLKDHYYQDWLPTLLGADKDFQATRVAFKLGLTGPAISVQTACSTSLVAVHMACQALISQEIDQALIAVASVRCPIVRGYLHEQGGVMSPDGLCRPFDAAASGTVFGSGAGAVLVKRLSDAVADGDCIRAVIKGSAINNDGSAKSDFTAPTIGGQSQVITEALGSADISADEISYVEAHGTGTSIGDPIEVAALTKAFRQDTEDNQYCYLGSVKGNIGHLDVAAGMASLLKVILALQHKTLPPCLNYSQANPQIDFPSTPFRIIENAEAWVPKSGHLRTAGITSLGMGGTNAHVIVQEYLGPSAGEPEVEEIAVITTSKTEGKRAGQLSPTGLTLLPLSAKDEPTLIHRAHDLGQFIQANQNPIGVEDLLTTLTDGRVLMSTRQITVVEDVDSAATRLLDEYNAYSVQSSLPIREREIIFMFPGQGSQVLGMGKTLYESEPVFQAVLNEVATIVNRNLGHDLLDILFSEESSSLSALLNQTEYTQPCLFAVQFAYVALLNSWGIKPAAVIGHSIGEYVAAVVAGIMTVETAAKIVTERGRLMQSVSPGAMMVVHAALGAAEVQVPQSLDVAVINSADSYVVAGDFSAIELFENTLRDANFRYTRLATSHAFHSRMMESILPEFTKFIANEHLQKATIPIISNVTGDWLTQNDAQSPDYWASQLRNAVQFEKGLSTILGRGELLALECGAGNTLTSLFNQHNDKQAGQFAIACAGQKRSPLSEAEAILLAVGALWCNGQTVELPQPTHRPGRRVSLPSYPFRGDHHWFEEASSAVRGSTTDEVSASGNSIRLKPEHWIQETTWNWLPVPIESTETKKTPIVGIGCDAEWIDNAFQSSLSEHCDIADVIALDAVPHLLIAWPEKQTDQSAVESLLMLLQALTKFDGVQTIKVDILTRGASGCLGSTVMQISASMAAAIALVTEREWPHIEIHTNDMPWDATQAEWELLAQQLRLSARPTVSAIRGGHCWERSTRSVVSKEEGRDRFFNSQGTVVLVGGFGGIGREFSDYFAEQEIPLILTHRPTETGDLTVEQLAWVDTLKEKGGSVATVALQPDDSRSTEDFTRFMSQQAHPIDAVIYLAGSVDDALIPMQNSKSITSVMAPKVDGVKQLIHAIESAKIQTKLVLFSSTAAWYGPVGQFNYAAANAYLMGLAKAKQQNFCKVISIAWPGWINTGMLKTVTDPHVLRTTFHEGITAEQGIKSLERCLNLGLDTAWVSPIALGFLPTDSQMESHQLLSSDTQEISEIATAIQPAESFSYESRITSNWQELLGIKNITPSQDYFDLGGTSLVALKLCARIERDMGVDFTVEDLMAAPTIELQAELIRERLNVQEIVANVAARADEPREDSLGDMMRAQPKQQMAHHFTEAPAQTGDVPDDLPAREKVKSLVELKLNAEKQLESPVYLVHAHGGMVVGYQKLARELSQHRSVFGLQAQGVRGECVPLRSIEAMADLYAQEIFEHSYGPYIIGGYCMGGTIAWAVADKLQSMGGEVKLVMMIQSFHQDLTYPIVQNGKTLYPYGASAYHKISLIKDKAVEVINRNLKQTGFSVKTILGVFQGAHARFMRTMLKNKNVQHSQVSDLDLNAKDDGALLAVHAANGDAFMTYSPTDSAMPVAFYSAQHQPAHIRNDFTLGYQKLSNGWISVRPIEGSFLQGLDGLSFKQISKNLELDLVEVEKTKNI